MGLILFVAVLLLCWPPEFVVWLRAGDNGSVHSYAPQAIV